MRGDRPIYTQVKLSGELATPYARGSTWVLAAHLVQDTGYPVCAGIDPVHTPRLAMPTGLPRMRGDRPAQHVCL